MSDPSQSPWIGSSTVQTPYHAETGESLQRVYAQVLLAPRKNGIGTTAFVISLIALLFSLIPYLVLVVPLLCVVGIILAVIGLLLTGRRKRGAAISLLFYLLAFILSAILAPLYG